MPLSCKETLALDSHRPLTYDNTQIAVQTPKLEDLNTRESGGAPTAAEEREDRIRTISTT